MVSAICEARRPGGASSTSVTSSPRCRPGVQQAGGRLIKAGAFDSLGHTWRGLTTVYEQALDAAIDVKRNEAMGQDSLFGGDDENGAALELDVVPPIPLAEWDKAILLAAEREMLGLYVSDHPLLGVEHVLAGSADCSIAALTTDETRQDGAVVTVGTRVRPPAQGHQAGQPVGDGDTGGSEGAIDVMFFPATYQQCATLLAEDSIVLVRGRLDRRRTSPSSSRWT